MTQEAEDVALKLLHTADWHIGRRFHTFDERDEQDLRRARVEVLDRILLLAEQHAVDAILCAGDLFDEAKPDRDWWEPVARKLAGMRTPRLVFLLPGNHDPLLVDSVWHPDHPFRRALPAWVQVVDSNDFTYQLSEHAVLHACPCRSMAGQDDPTLALPMRAPGDDRIRIGMVHGSTFDAIDCQINFPISRTAAADRGFDYLAIGDTHSFRNVPHDAVPPVVYPGSPEPGAFDEAGAGCVVLVFASRSRRVRFRAERVAYWSWSERHIRSLSELRELRGDASLAKAVLRLIIDLRLSAPELEEANQILRELKGTPAAHGRVGILQVDRKRLLLDTTNIENVLDDMPDVLRAAVGRLHALETGDASEVARAALYHLYRLVQGAQAS
jgi:DNA repair exonuclease SbcCD nuclease subunit